MQTDAAPQNPMTRKTPAQDTPSPVTPSPDAPAFTPRRGLFAVSLIVLLTWMGVLGYWAIQLHRRASAVPHSAEPVPLVAEPETPPVSR